MVPEEPPVVPSPAEIEEALRLGRAARRVIQEGLTATGFDPGVADGLFGAGTRAALREWQEARGAAATGYLDAAAAAALQAAAEEAVQVAAQRGAELEAAQQRAAAARQAELEAEAQRQAELDAADRQDAPGRRSLVPGEVFRDCERCPEMVVVPAGEFTMGSPASEEGRDGDEWPQHRVVIGSPFAVGVHEVTFAEWDACVSGSGCGGYRPDDEGRGRGRQPVMNVSWEDAQGYVSWLSDRVGFAYRLLSESEWEYVARAGTSTPYWWGDEVGRNHANCIGCGSRWDGQTAPVGSFSANGFGLHDVLGNVREWVEDCRHPDDGYRGAPSDGSAWTSGGDCGRRVLRGGSFISTSRDLRVANRMMYGAGRRLDLNGFRVARTLD